MIGSTRGTLTRTQGVLVWYCEVLRAVGVLCGTVRHPSLLTASASSVKTVLLPNSDEQWPGVCVFVRARACVCVCV